MIDEARELSEICAHMNIGIPVEHKTRLFGETFLVLEGNTMTCHIRRYFKSADNKHLPTRMGVTMHPTELLNLMKILPQMHSQLIE